MKLIFLLSKENLKMSCMEAASLCKLRNYKLVDNVLVGETDKTNYKKLAYTNYVLECMFQEKQKNLLKKIKKYDWQNHYKRSFAVRTIGDGLNAIKIADIIYSSLKNPKVNLANPATQFTFICVKNNVFAGRLLWSNKKEFMLRKPHMRPALHPSSLNPRLAKACINIVIDQGTLLDPFCGTGGILIEAGLMGIKTIGYDIDDEMLERARKNMEYYKIKNYTLKKHDSKKIGIKADAIVTDLPYGRNTKTRNLDALFKAFMKQAFNSTDNAVIIFPSIINYKKYLYKWKVKRVFTYYLHKGLSRNILLLGK